MQEAAMSRMSPPRSYTDREPSFAAGGARRKRRRSRRERLIELWQALRPHHAVLAASILVEISLFIIALVPQNTWAGLGYPSGPIPDFLEPVAAGLFYILPTLTGALCRKWMTAVVLATLPAWLDLCVFAVAS